jgi:hypothetical protein
MATTASIFLSHGVSCKFKEEAFFSKSRFKSAFSEMQPLQLA